jgi:prepilin-type N-terminal cleavage/methylation domain-containing protein
MTIKKTTNAIRRNRQQTDVSADFHAFSTAHRIDLSSAQLHSKDFAHFLTFPLSHFLRGFLRLLSHFPTCTPAPKAGFTLVEVLVTLVIIGLMGTVAGTVISRNYENEISYEATVEIMDGIREAILGKATALNRGVHISGYVSDMGSLPPLNENHQPEALWRQTQGLQKSTYYSKARISIGWNGPYIDPPDSGTITDGWGTALAFAINNENGAIRITSYGADLKPGGTGIDEDIVLTIKKHQYMSPLGLQFKGLAQDMSGTEFQINYPGNGTLQTAYLKLDQYGRFVSDGDSLFPIGLRSITARIKHGNHEESRVLVFPMQPGMNYLGTIE